MRFPETLSIPPRTIRKNRCNKVPISPGDYSGVPLIAGIGIQ